LSVATNEPGESAGEPPGRVGQEGVATEQKAPEPKVVSRGSIRKSKRSPKTLSTSPAMRFIVRKDLYSFLSGAGVSGRESEWVGLGREGGGVAGWAWKGRRRR